LSGTDTLRPSRSSTTSAESVTRTRLATAASIAGLEEVMPRLEKRGPVSLHQRRNLIQFILRESAVRRHPDRVEPEFRHLPFAGNVNVRRLGPVTRKEEEPVRTASENRGTHDDDSASFAIKRTRSCDPPNAPNEPRAIAT